MTREQAINVLNILKRYYNDRNEDSYVGFDNEDNEAFDLAIKALEHWPCDDPGEISDGYHTFNQLYHQRAILFAAIVNQNTDISWKSYKHSDGKYCFDSNGEWFIVGVDTPEGSYTYHYSKEYWDYFRCQELDCGKEWDGHTEEDVTRLLSLEYESCGDCISRNAIIETLNGMDRYIASELTLCESNDKFPQNEVFIVDDVYEQIAEQLPSVEPDRKTGKWFLLDECANEGWYCDQCHKKVFKADFSNTMRKFKFCPNCGSKMEVDDGQG